MCIYIWFSLKRWYWVIWTGGAQALSDLLMPAWLFSWIHCNTGVGMKTSDPSSWKGLLCFVLQLSPIFSVSLLSLSLCPFSLLSLRGLPSCSHCLFLAISGPSGSLGVTLHLNPSPSWCAVPPFLPPAWVLALSHHLCLSHCWLALSPFLAYLVYLIFLHFFYSSSEIPRNSLCETSWDCLHIFFDFPQHLRYTKVHSEGEMCQNLRWRKAEVKRLTWEKGKRKLKTTGSMVGVH